MPELIKTVINNLTNPSILVTLSVIIFILGLILYKKWTSPQAVFPILTGVLIIFGLSLLDENFRKIVAKPDNVPIVGMFFLAGFFIWLSLRQAAITDERIKAGKPAGDVEDSDKFLTWPDLVYIELIAILLASVFLIVWAIVLKAPLEEAANPAKSPNPAKAPWYFLGLQELLVYFDPWIAGVILPGMIIIGLMAIPYLDINPKGNGYYTISERKFAISAYLFGFVVLWVVLIFIGTVLRGPNWNFFGPYEYWDIHKLVPLVNINLSEIIWTKWLGRGMPENIIIRESSGIILVLAYLFIIPVILAKTGLRDFYKKTGFIRYYFIMIFILVMFGVLIKMYLRWIFNLKYIVSIPEYSLNI